VGFGDDWLLQRLLFLIPIVLSVTVHEWAHAWSAYRLGDHTAAGMGRLTLNPLEHMDPIGTLLLPLLGVPFGWAKPVPINPARFHRDVSMGMGLVITAAAGPAANLVLAAVAAGGLGLMAQLGAAGAAESAAGQLLRVLVLINLLLACFNLLPIPPLDGSRIADGLMPRRLRPAWDALTPLAPVALGAVILLPLFAGVNLFAWPLALAQSLVDALVTGFTG